MSGDAERMAGEWGVWVLKSEAQRLGLFYDNAGGDVSRHPYRICKLMQVCKQDGLMPNAWIMM